METATFCAAAFHCVLTGQRSGAMATATAGQGGPGAGCEWPAERLNTAHVFVPVLCTQLMPVPDIAECYFTNTCYFLFPKSPFYILVTLKSDFVLFVRFHSPNSFSPVGEESRITSILSG